MNGCKYFRLAEPEGYNPVIASKKLFLKVFLSVRYLFKYCSYFVNSYMEKSYINDLVCKEL